MKTIFRVILALMTLIAFSAAQAATGVPPTSTIQNASTGECLTIANPLTMTACDVNNPRQIFNMASNGMVLNPHSLPWLGNGAGTGICLNGSFTADGVAGQVSMAPCVQLTGYWYRAGLNGAHIHMSGSQHCLTQTGSGVEMQACDLAFNQDWVLSSAIAPDWPQTGLVAMINRGAGLQSPTGRCLQLMGGQLGYMPGMQLGLGSCEEYPNMYFQFTPRATIELYGMCVTAGNGTAGDSVTLNVCSGSKNQKWLHLIDNLFMSRSQSRCLGMAGNSAAVGAKPQMQDCLHSNAFQSWYVFGLSPSWPPADSVPSTAVKGATLTSLHVSQVVDWIQSEQSIIDTPFCYKTSTYDRGVGSLPTCASGQEMDAGLCYTPCRSGFFGVGPVCWTTQSLTYNPGTHCVYDALGTCWPTMNSCRAGYTGDGVTTCYIDQASYGRGVGSLPNGCSSGYEMQAGLCYPNPRAGYSCNVTVCSPFCAAGTFDCLGSACSKDQASCASSIADMVISPLETIAFIATGGAAGAAKEAITLSMAAYKLAENSPALYQAEETLRNDIESFMQAAEEDLASMSSTDIEAAVAKGYGRGSANYKFIAREWAYRLLLSSIAQLTTDVSIMMASAALDPAGIYATIEAFAKPPCEQHTTMPQF